MDSEHLQKNLVSWKRILWIDVGAVLTLLATAFAEIPNHVQPYFPGWYAVWLIIFLASLLPGCVLLWGKHWMILPLKDRLNTIFGFFGLTWISLLSIEFENGFQIEFVYFLLPVGAAIYLVYYLMERKIKRSKEEIFP